MDAFSADVALMMEAARSAGAGLLTRFADLAALNARTKSGPADLVSIADEEAELETRRTLERDGRGYAFLGEEGGARAGSADAMWIVDPLDGTTNFLFGCPFWGVNVALARGGRVVAGVTYLPVLDELYVAEEGRGAFLNGKRLQVSTRGTLIESVVSCGMPFAGKPDHAVFAREMSLLTPITSGMRRTGACAVDMAYVAAGRWDAYWERALNAWDMAPGVILVQEAGGRATSVTGGALDLHGGNVCVSNGAMHDDLVAQLNLALTGAER